MDFSSAVEPIINQMKIFIVGLIFVFILVRIVKSSWFKGIWGEFIVNVSAKLFLDKDKYHLIKNVIIPAQDGTTQIDHIIISIYGIFVIETKNMKGWIFGSERQRDWTQKIYRYQTKFQNPLRQNYKHVKALESFLGVEECKLHSLVVFVGDSTFKTQMPDNVTYRGGYIRYIKSKSQVLISEAEVSDILNAFRC